MDSELKRRMSPPLSLITLASLTPEPHRVCIEDENLKNIDFSDHPDLVGITVNVNTAYRAFEIADTYRKSGAKVILGGIHASVHPDAMLEHCDSVCVGEAEELWTQIINDCSAGALQRIYSSPTGADMSLVPLPVWSYVSRNQYLYTNIIVASRGCPFQCEFCYNSCDYTHKIYRNRPVENVVREIENLGTRQAMFIDDNFVGNIGWVKEFTDRVSGMDIVWHCAASTNIMDHPNVIDRMADSGCRSMFIGFESINAGSIASVSKKQNRVDKYEHLITMLHDRGIMVNASMAFGFDHDTVDTFGYTLDWLVKNKIETMTGHILTPYPGTKLYKRLLKEGRIIDFDLSRYNTSNVVFRPKNMTPEELRDGYLKIYDDFYSMRNIIRRMPEHRRSIAPYFLFNLGYRKYGLATSLIGKLGFMGQVGGLARRLSYGI